MSLRETQASSLLQLTSFISSVPTSIVYDEGGNKGLEGERHSQDKVTATPPPLDTSTTPLMEPSRAHSISKPNRSPQISHPVVEDHSEFEEPKPAKVPLPKVVPALPPRDATSDSSGNGPQVESGAFFPQFFMSH